MTNKIKETFDSNAKDVKYIIEERINKTIVGRNNEIECFKKQFDRVLEGGMGLSVVSGKPGIGKTFFVEYAAGLFISGNATYVYGKCRQYDKNPLGAIAEVIEQTVRHILTLPTQSLKHIKNDCIQKLGTDSAIILSICPYAGILLGAHKAVHTDSLEQLKYKVRKAVHRFLEIASTALFPLIVFIDDLQWADTLSLNVIEALCKDYDFFNLQLVLAYRDNEHGKARLNPGKLPQSGSIFIELAGLAYEDIAQYVQLIFERNIEHQDYLIRILYGLTLGNPFNINRILRLFLRENVLSYSDPNKKWLVQFDEMENLNLPADMEQLVREQIEGLQDEDKKLLELIACYGGKIKIELLRILTGTEDVLLNNQLDRLCKNYLLVKTVQDNRLQAGFNYNFAHDIVLKLTYENLNSEEKSKIHYHIAGTLTDMKGKTFAASNSLIIASHLLRVDRHLLKQDKTKKWIDELYQAGVTARQTTAVEQALAIFACCADLLLSCDQEEKSGLSLSVHLELGECQFICERVEEAKQRFEALMAKYPETENLIKIKSKYINLSACNGDFEKVMKLGLEILAHLNLKLALKYLIADLIQCKLLFRDKKIKQLKNAPVITDQRLLRILETLTIMAPSANRVNDQTSVMIALKLAILSVKHGDSDYSPVAYATYCYVLFHILKDHKKGKQLEDVALALLQQSQNASSKSAAYCIMGSLIHHWSNPLGDTIGCLEKSIEEGEKEGAFLYGSYAITFTIITKYVMGAPLTELKRYIRHCQKKQKRLEHYLTRCIYDMYLNHIHQLAEGTPSEEKEFPEEEQKYKNKELFADTIKLNGDMIYLQRLYLEGKIEKAYRLAEDIAPKVGLHKGFVLNVEFLFYSLLVRIARHQDLYGAKKKHNQKLIKKYLKELKDWVLIYKHNHYARYLLAQAEYDAMFARGKSPDKLYQEAMDFAGGQGNIPLEALANLLAAKYHGANRKLARFYGTEAVNLYKKWGAIYIGDLIAKNMGLEWEPVRHEEGASRQPGVDGEDSGKKAEHTILFHLSKIEKMQEDEGYLYLLNLLIHENYTDYGAVFFEKSGEMYLKYEKRKDSQAYVHQDLINMNHLSSLPHKIIRYVARTEAEIVFDKKHPGGIFAGDSYLMEKDRLSLACLPIKYLGVLLGVLYLEKAGEDGFGNNTLSFVKGFIPSLLSKKTNIREVVNMQNVLNTPNKNSLFTGRELEVLKLVAEGKSNSEISMKLHITLGTVRNHLSNIYAKLEVDNRVKAVLRAKELKIIQL